MKNIIWKILLLCFPLAVWGQNPHAVNVGSTGGSGSTADTFNLNQPVLRGIQVGDTIGGNSFEDLARFLFSSPPTININSISPSVFEVGTEVTITLSGTVNNPGNTTLSNGELRKSFPLPETIIHTFGSNTSFSFDVTLTPEQGGVGDYNVPGDYRFYASIGYSGAGESGVVTSVVRESESVYPYFHGMSAVDYSTASGTTLYTSDLTKVVQSEGNKSISFTGTNEFMYFAVPATWGDGGTPIDAIIDPNNLDNIAGFTPTNITVSSTGLTDNYIDVPYVIYKLNNITTLNDATYSFNR